MARSGRCIASTRRESNFCATSWPAISAATPVRAGLSPALRLLDIGCGGGLLCEPLARLGFAVTGIDADRAALKVARAHAKGQRLAIDYRAAIGRRDWPRRACASMPCWRSKWSSTRPIRRLFLATASRLVTPGGAFAASTLNRTPEAFLFAILGAEYLLRWLPRGTHDFKKFLRPSELASRLREAGLRVERLAGLSYEPWRDRWRVGPDLGVNYLLFATKPAEK